MQDLSIAQILNVVGLVLICLAPLLGLLRVITGFKIYDIVLLPGLCVAAMVCGLTSMHIKGPVSLQDYNYPWSTYIEEGTTLAEGDTVVEKLPEKFQEAVTKLRYGTGAYSLSEATAKRKLKGDGIQQDHTVVWLNRPESDGFWSLKRRSIFVGVSHDITAKVEHALKVELSEDELREMMTHFPSELREPVMSTYAAGGYKAYGLGPATYSTFNSVTDVCAIQLIKEKQMPMDIANQRQRFIVDEIDVYVQDVSITANTMHHP